MNARIASYRGSHKTKYDNHMIVHVDDCTSKEDAQKLVGKKITWVSPGKKVLRGKVASPHGAKGCVRVIFETGMPGQSLGTEVKIE